MAGLQLSLGLEYLNEFLVTQGFIQEKIDLDSFIDESYFNECSLNFQHLY